MSIINDLGIDLTRIGRTAFILARSKNGVIGIGDSALPWKIRDDMRIFAALTKGGGSNAVIVGGKTFRSFPKPLAGRTTIVWTRDIDKHLAYEMIDNTTAVMYTREVLNAFNLAAQQHLYDRIWIAGGAQCYKYMASNAIIDSLVVSDVDVEIEHPDAVSVSIDPLIWRLEQEVPVPAGEGNDHPFTLRIYSRQINCYGM